MTVGICGRRREEEAFVVGLVVLVRHLLPPVDVALPQTLVTHLLDLREEGRGG